MRVGLQQLANRGERKRSFILGCFLGVNATHPQRAGVSLERDVGERLQEYWAGIGDFIGMETKWDGVGMGVLAPHGEYLAGGYLLR